ncbi:MAG: hypothetical protein PHQ12_02180 [Chthoniobacteraceae bacterium]|nr:hypothetical protein [Chthoniobacteraceae bacterium]
MENILNAHLSLCERVYDLILQENQILKETGKAPSEEVLDRKRGLLAELEGSLERLRAANAAPSPRTQSQRMLIDRTQQVVMKTLLLDRENEQLLLKGALTSKRPPASPKPSLNRLQRIYGGYYSV